MEAKRELIEAVRERYRSAGTKHPRDDAYHHRASGDRSHPSHKRNDSREKVNTSSSGSAAYQTTASCGASKTANAPAAMADTRHPIIRQDPRAQTSHVFTIWTRKLLILNAMG